MQKLACLVRYGSRDFWVVVSRSRHRNPGHEIDIAVAIDVLNHCRVATGDNKRVLLWTRARHPCAITCDDRLRARPWRKNANVGVVARFHGRSQVPPE